MKNKEPQPKGPQEKAQLAKYASESWRLRDWFEDVSSITIHPTCADSIRFKLDAFGLGMLPQEGLTISVVGCPEYRMYFGVDRKALQRLGKWFIESAYLLDSLREKKEEQIRRAQKQLAEIHEQKSYSQWSKKSKR
jgi:hypothetical protein